MTTDKGEKYEEEQRGHIFDVYEPNGTCGSGVATRNDSTSNVATNTNPTSPKALAPANMARDGTVDDRFQSYNVENSK